MATKLKNQKSQKGGNYFLPIKKCHICGKKFCRINFVDYVYKEGPKYFCGYNCMRTAERRGMIKNYKINIIRS